MRRLLYLLAVFAVVALLGLQFLSSMMDILEKWGGVTDRLCSALRMINECNSNPTVYRAMFIAPLSLIVLISGYFIALMNRQIEKEALKPSAGAPPAVPPPLNPASYVWEGVSTIQRDFVGAIAYAFKKKPWWFITVAVTLASLLFIRAEIPSEIA